MRGTKDTNKYPDTFSNSRRDAQQNILSTKATPKIAALDDGVKNDSDHQDIMCMKRKLNLKLSRMEPDKRPMKENIQGVGLLTL